MPETLGDLIRQAREARGIKAYELAKRIDRQPSYISDIENGKRSEMLPPDVVAALSRELGLSPVAMLRAWGYDLPEGETPEDPRVVEFMEQVEYLTPAAFEAIRMFAEHGRQQAEKKHSDGYGSTRPQRVLSS